MFRGALALVDGLSPGEDDGELSAADALAILAHEANGVWIYAHGGGSVQSAPSLARIPIEIRVDGGHFSFIGGGDGVDVATGSIDETIRNVEIRPQHDSASNTDLQ